MAQGRQHVPLWFHDLHRAFNDTHLQTSVQTNFSLVQLRRRRCHSHFLSFFLVFHQ